jgi:hypothetical protein
VIQEVDKEETITHLDGQTHTYPMPSIWEAWHISAGHVNADQTNNEGYDDDLAFKDARPLSRGDRISTTLTATARYYEGLNELPPSFHRDATEPLARPPDTYVNDY